MRLEDYATACSHSARVISSQRITAKTASEEVREIVLEVEREDFAYQPGQSIGVIVPGDDEFGNKHHFRLYSVADVRSSHASKPRVTLCVRRCNYIDDYSGEAYRGAASNFLCDLREGDSATINGPFGIPFEVPSEHDADLILIGMGTGIAPFRALVRHIYQDVKDWRGNVWLFYGARSGLELLYMNDERDDFSQYYDQQTFAAFKSLSPRPHWEEPFAMDYALEQRSSEIVTMLEKPRTYLYVSGRQQMLDALDRSFARIIGSAETWARRKAELVAGKRWIELIY